MKEHKKLSLAEKQALKNHTNWKAFFLTIIFGIPLWLFCLVPLTIGYKLLEFLLTKFGIMKKVKATKIEEISSDKLEKTTTSKDNREFDLVVFGATGFTGNFMCQYLAKQYELVVGEKDEDHCEGKKLRWAIAGRSVSKLAQLRGSLAKHNPAMKDLPVIKADSYNLEEIWDMVGRTKVVVSTVGPYYKYGNNLVHACAEQNTDYCDITGEINWVRYNVNKYQETARQSGARIVFSSGCDSVPWDLATHQIALQVDEDDELVRVDHLNDCHLSISGGTLATILSMIDNTSNCSIKPRPKFDPLVGEFDGEKGYVRSESKFVIKNFAGLSRVGKGDSRWKVFSPFAGGNSRIVSRSQTLNHYSSKMIYSEASVASNLPNAILYYFGLIMLATCIVLKPIRMLLLKYSLLPSPGQGPTREAMKSHYFVIESTGLTAKGNTIKLKSMFNEDIGYKDTARMLAEAGLCFVFDHKSVTKEGGIYSPASSMGTELKNRLENSHTHYKFE